MRSRVVMCARRCCDSLGGVLIVPAAYAKFSGGGDAPAPRAGRPDRRTPTVPPTNLSRRSPRLAAGPVQVKVDGFF